MAVADAGEVILVDEDDTVLGVCDKATAHREGRLHRAFSIVLFDPTGRWILQKRAWTKYHSSGLWSNACCGHPRSLHDIAADASLRLHQEMRISCPIQEVFSFIYRCDCGRGMSEYEYDHVFLGTYEGVISPNPEEVAGWTTISAKHVRKLMQDSPERFTYWFRELFFKLLCS